MVLKPTTLNQPNKTMHTVSSSGSYVVTSDGKVTINGETTKTPKGMKFNSMSQIGDDIYIGGYEFDAKTKTFKRSLRALWYLYF